MSKQPRKHHFVPQFLLKNFQSYPGANLYCFNKRDGSIFPSKPANLFAQRDFYTIQKQQIMEEFYSKFIETNCADVIDKLVRSYSLKGLSDKEFELLKLFCFAQSVRTPRTKDSIKKITKAVISKMRKIESTSNKKLLDMQGRPIPLKGITEDEINQQQAMMVLANFNIGVKAIGLNKSVYLFCPRKKEDVFYIGDNPVVMHQTNRLAPYGAYGLAVPNIEIYLPLSPKLTVGFMDKNIPLTHRHPDKSTILLDTEQTEFLNRLQVGWAKKYVVSSTDDFQTAKDFLEKNPLYKTDQEGTNIRF